MTIRGNATHYPADQDASLEGRDDVPVTIVRVNGLVRIATGRPGIEIDMDAPSALALAGGIAGEVDGGVGQVSCRYIDASGSATEYAECVLMCERDGDAHQIDVDDLNGPEPDTGLGSAGVGLRVPFAHTDAFVAALRAAAR